MYVEVSFYNKKIWKVRQSVALRICCVRVLLINNFNLFKKVILIYTGIKISVTLDIKCHLRCQNRTQLGSQN